MTYEQDMAVREKYWYKEGMAAQKAEDEKIIQEIVQEKELELQEKDVILQQNATVLQEKLVELQEKDAEIARILKENARMKAQLAEKA